MADTFSNDLRLRLQESGSNAGTWGDLLNGTITNIASGFGQGSEAIPNASTHTITLADGTADEARSLYLKCTGGGQACTVTLGPNTISKVWIIDNATSYTLTFSQGSGANVAIAAGAVKVIATDGAGSGAAVVDTLDGLEGSLSTLAVTGALTVDTDTLVVDATNNRVGINRALPSGLLHMQSSSGTDSALYIQTSATSDDSVIYFGDDGSSSVGRINYSHSDNGFSFWTDGTRRLDIDSSGNLIVGSTNPAPVSNNVVGVSIRNFGEVQMSTNNQGPLYLNRKGTDGALVTLRKENVDVGSIGVEAGDNFYIADAATNTGLNFKGFINPCDSSGASSRDNFDLGHSTQGRLRDLYLGGGVYLGGTGAANKLEDYEYGTWTPVIAGCTISIGRANYVKIGGLVKLDFNVVITGNDNSGSPMLMTGVPFTASSANSESVGSPMLRYFDFDSGATDVVMYHYSRTPTIEFYEVSDDSNWSLLRRDQITSNSAAIIGTITITVD